LHRYKPPIFENEIISTSSADKAGCCTNFLNSTGMLNSLSLLKRAAVKRLFLIVFTVSILITNQCQGQSLRFTVLTSHDGLLSNTINAIIKDRYGFLWFATADGLDRFDGLEGAVLGRYHGGRAILP
jgi:hypothetical protein